METDQRSAGRQKTLTEHIASRRKLEGKLDNFESEFQRLKQECAADLQKLSLDVDDAHHADIDKAALTKKRDALIAEKDGCRRRAVACRRDKPARHRRPLALSRIKALQDKLDAPNKRYQDVSRGAQGLAAAEAIIEGDADKTDTLKYYEAQLKYIKEQLPVEIEAMKQQPRSSLPQGARERSPQSRMCTRSYSRPCRS